jgi:acyl carrier protein
VGISQNKKNVVAGSNHNIVKLVWFIVDFCEHFSTGAFYLHDFLDMDKLKVIFSNILGVPVSAITNEMSPKNTSSWDSLNAIVLITEIEKGFSMIFSYDEAMSVKNFGEVVALLKSKGIVLND